VSGIGDAAPLDRARETLAATVRRLGAQHLNACVRCGLCAESCHVYRGQPEPANHPGAKVARVAAHFRRRHTFLGRHLPGLVGARDLTAETLAELSESVFGRCTACGRCGLHCSIGLDVASVIRAGRAAVAAAGCVPEGIRKTLENQLQTGNQMAIPRDEFLATVAWLTESLREETGDAAASIPVDEPGRRALYLVNPREVKFFPLSLIAAAGVFRAAGESWTLSSRCFDVTNYGLFAADDAAAGELARRVLAEAQALGVEEIILSECGHGFRALRWEAPSWLGAAHPLPVRSVLELLEEYLDAGRLRVDPAKNPEPVTLHDPCNLVRWGGMSEPQRRVLRRVVADFREMTPNREQNFCCGGGGGLLSLGEFGARRVQSGRPKAEQIRATGARLVATPCHNCADQLLEINKHYKLGVGILAVVELVYAALA
jgi:Fe-S oxidoreductase